mgnify:FL=1
MRKDMIATVEYGTGKKAKIEGYTFGGKTGTAQQAPRSEGKYTVSFVGFIPAENPQYIAIILIHKPESYADGVTTVAPMMKGLMENIIKYAGIEPSYTVEGTSSDKTEEKITVSDYTGSTLFDVLADLDAKGLTYEVVGNGNSVVNQAPHGGTQVSTGSKVLIYVEKGSDESSTANIVVPDVKGKTFEEAKKAIEAEGLTAKAEGDESGVVQKTSPSYGVSVESGSEVTLTLVKSDDTAEDENQNGEQVDENTQ